MTEQEPDKCPICLKTSGIDVKDWGWGSRIKCSTCGEFYVSEELYHYTLEKLGRSTEEYIKNKFVIQGGLREKKSPDKQRPVLLTIKQSTPKDDKDVYAISLEDYFNFLSPFPQNPSQKIDKLLENLEKISEGNYGCDFGLNYQMDYPLGYARDSREFSFLLGSMRDQGLFSDYRSLNTGPAFHLSIEAWERIEENKKKRVNVNQGFVACWFSDEHDSFRNAIERGIHNAGYTPISIKEKHYPDTILSKALGEIRNSRFVVVDLTGQRDTVFVEFGFALGQDVEPILVIREDDWKNLKEFYVTNYNVFRYKDEKHLEKIVEAAIAERIGTRTT